MEKKCTKCENVLPIEEFTKNKNQPDGYFYRCKGCENKRKKEFYYSGYDKVMSDKQPNRREYNKKYHSNMDVFKLRWRTAKQRARLKGFEFNLTIEHIVELFEKQNGLCYISGVELSLEKHSPKTLSVDRIDSSMGYIIGNIGLCTDFINNSKSNYSLDEFKKLLTEIVLT
jgi:hypothetical protein